MLDSVFCLLVQALDAEIEDLLKTLGDEPMSFGAFCQLPEVKQLCERGWYQLQPLALMLADLGLGLH